MQPIPFEADPEHCRLLVGGEPMIFHCHHFNAYLHRTVAEASYLGTGPVLIGAGAEVAHAQFRALFDRGGVKGPDRARLAEALYRWAGFGTFDLSGLGQDGGTVRTRHSHYALGWRARFGAATAPVCHFSAGWLAGALAAIHDRPDGAYGVRETQCAAVDGAECVFEVSAAAPSYTVFPSPGVGPLTPHRPRPVPAGPVDHEGIPKAVGGLPLVGNEDGMIPAFGVYLTRHYANYYNRVMFETERRLVERFGAEGHETGASLFVEAGHICAFHTMGGIMTSPEWDALIRPTLRTREDWIQGIVAVINALGWGRWQATKVSEAEAEFVLHDDYESVGYLGMYGRSPYPISYLAQGGVAGLMNLVYVGNIAERPELSLRFYDTLFRASEGYAATPTASRATGDEVTAFRVVRR